MASSCFQKKKEKMALSLKNDDETAQKKSHYVFQATYRLFIKTIYK